MLYIPLDERFTTRDAFLNLARVTPFKILSPPRWMLPSRKVSANLTALDAWVQSHAAEATHAVVSLELYVYGGLISSRCSNTTSADVMARVDKLLQLPLSYPGLKLYLATVVMRIPSYNEDEEVRARPPRWRSPPHSLSHGARRAGAVVLGAVRSRSVHVLVLR